MNNTPHKYKIIAAIKNPKCIEDKKLLEEAFAIYEGWIKDLNKLSSKGKTRVVEMVNLLNFYKDSFEVDLIAKQGSTFLKRQKGQLKLDNSIIEEFLIHLINPNILTGLDNLDKLEIGPKNTFMSLAFFPKSVKDLDDKPNITIKTKDQDFIVGKKIHYKFASTETFQKSETSEGALVLAVLAAECKVNLDKTMFQEASGTASRLKQGCPVARYYVLVEYLDMIPEDCRLTAIDNVFLLRHTRRLPYEKRNIVEEVENQHKKYPIDPDLVWAFVQEIQQYIDVIWYDPDKTLERGTFI